jgi:hypothetical protein
VGSEDPMETHQGEKMGGGGQGKKCRCHIGITSRLADGAEERARTGARACLGVSTHGPKASREFESSKRVQGKDDVRSGSHPIDGGAKRTLRGTPRPPR